MPVVATVLHIISAYISRLLLTSWVGTHYTHYRCPQLVDEIDELCEAARARLSEMTPREALAAGVCVSVCPSVSVCVVVCVRAWTRVKERKRTQQARFVQQLSGLYLHRPRMPHS